jgi:hypothetical protein
MGWKHLHFRACASAYILSARLTQNCCGRAKPSRYQTKFIAPTANSPNFYKFWMWTERRPIRTQTMADAWQQNRKWSASAWNFLFFYFSHLQQFPALCVRLGGSCWPPKAGSGAALSRFLSGGAAHKGVVDRDQVINFTLSATQSILFDCFVRLYSSQLQFRFCSWSRYWKGNEIEDIQVVLQNIWILKRTKFVCI